MLSPLTMGLFSNIFPVKGLELRRLAISYHMFLKVYPYFWWRPSKCLPTTVPISDKRVAVEKGPAHCGAFVLLPQLKLCHTVPPTSCICEFKFKRPHSNPVKLSNNGSGYQRLQHNMIYLGLFLGLGTTHWYKNTKSPEKKIVGL